MSMVSDVAINVIDEDVDCQNIRVSQQNSNFDCTEIPLVWFGTESNKKSEKEELILICHQGKIVTNGPKSKNWSIVLEEMKKIPFNKRSTLRSLSFTTNIPASTLHYLLQK